MLPSLFRPSYWGKTHQKWFLELLHSIAHHPAAHQAQAQRSECSFPLHLKHVAAWSILLNPSPSFAFWITPFKPTWNRPIVKLECLWFTACARHPRNLGAHGAGAGTGTSPGTSYGTGPGLRVITCSSTSNIFIISSSLATSAVEGFLFQL